MKNITPEMEAYINNVANQAADEIERLNLENEQLAQENAKLAQGIAALATEKEEALAALIDLSGWVSALRDWAGGTSIDPPIEAARAIIARATQPKIITLICPDCSQEFPPGEDHQCPVE